MEILPFVNKITVVHDGIDTQAVAPNSAVSLTLKMAAGQDLILTRQEEVITFVNRNFEPYRGYHTFMRALPQLLKERLIAGASLRLEYQSPSRLG